MNAKLSKIGLILDRSGSMSMMRAGAIEGFNAFLAAQQADPDEAIFTLVLFDDLYEVPYDSVPIADIPLLTNETFIPRGWTALNDAIGKTITDFGKALEAMPEDERPGHVIIAILTDGEENKSTEFTTEQIVEMMKHQQDVYKWEFFMLASDLRTQTSPVAMAMPAANNMAYAASDAGTREAFANISTNVTSARHS